MARPATPLGAPPAESSEGVAVDFEAPSGSHGEQASGLESVVADESDDVIVPPPPLDYLGHTRHGPSSGGFVVKPKYQSLTYKQTITPILLTTGLCMFALGACRFILSEDTALGNLPIFIPFVLFFAGAVSLVFGILTMLQVKHSLDEVARTKAEATAAAEAAS